ncbi:MAG: type II methionyl aminopeptidase [Methanomicrobiales archaeon]|nr:type II methionyl aminopeptidase [Methanomicrobiales archaeon]
MKEEVLESYLEAGRIAARVLSRGKGRIMEGRSLLEAVTTIEQDVVEGEGAGLAFPLNLSINEDAAHDTAMHSDGRVFRRGDLVKLDLGVHIDGYIADIAVTVDLGDHSRLVSSSRDALEAAIAMVRPDTPVGALGGAIQQAIESQGYHPIRNLTGHGLDRFMIHTSPTVPNIGISGGPVLREGMVFAIEPFASTGMGVVSERPRTEIYQQIAIKPVRFPAARSLLESIRSRRGMPFAKRWLQDHKLDLALRSLLNAGVIRGYPVLHDIAGSLVSQHEHTLVVTEDGAIVTTR